MLWRRRGRRRETKHTRALLDFGFALPSIPAVRQGLWTRLRQHELVIIPTCGVRNTVILVARRLGYRAGHFDLAEQTWDAVILIPGVDREDLARRALARKLQDDNISHSTVDPYSSVRHVGT